MRRGSLCVLRSADPASASSGLLYMTPASLAPPGAGALLLVVAALHDALGHHCHSLGLLWDCSAKHGEHAMP